MLNKTRLLTPGPTPLPERVRLAMARDMIHHRKDVFRGILLHTEEMLQKLFGTTQPVIPLSSSGTGAMTAAAYSLFRPGDKVIVARAGKFGERWEQICKMRGLDVVAVTAEYGRAISVAQVTDAMAANPDAKGIFIQMSETSTGVLHPVKEIAAVTRNSSMLFVVDGISGIGISPCPMDEWGIDCLLTGSQKGLMLPPGLAMIALSERAWKQCEETEPGCFYFNLPAERDKLAKGQTHFTTPVSLICGLEESLSIIFEFGLDNLYRKQWAMTQMCRVCAEQMGLTAFAPENYTWGITSLVLPDAIDGVAVVRDCAEKHGIYIAGGQDHLKGRILRVGHMGWVDWADVAATMYAINRSILDQKGFCGSRDYLEQGLAAYRAALEGEPGVPVQWDVHN